MKIISLKKRIGQRTVPWGTPDVTGMVSDFLPSMTIDDIDCVRWLRKSDIQASLFIP